MRLDHHVLFFVVAALGGCAAPGAIRSDAFSYEDVIETTTDGFLVANILRARDRAPLHFVDIPIIRESIQSTATVAPTFFVGPRGTSTDRSSIAPSLSVQATPSFEVSHLNSKEFVTGIASPVDPKFLKYWLDRGLDPRIVLLLFVSSVDIVDKGTGQSLMIRNDPRGAIPYILAEERSGVRAPCGASDFSRFLRIVNALPSVRATTYVARTGIGDAFALDLSKNLKDVATLDFSKVEIAVEPDPADPKKKYRLYRLSAPKTALCYGPSAARFEGHGAASSDACKGRAVTTETAEDEPRTSLAVRLHGAPQSCEQFHAFLKSVHDRSSKANDLSLRVSLRSVGEMIQFLGDVLAYQDALRDFQAREGRSLQWHNVPLTLAYRDDSGGCPPQESETSACAEQDRQAAGGALFDLSGDPAGARFSVRYREHLYAVAGATAADHSLEVLSVLHQLVDLNKSAKDLGATPVVQLLH